MKNQSFFINNRGFILPSITLIILIVFIVLTTNIMIYKQEIIMAKNHLEQLKVESLIKLGIESYKNDTKNSGNFVSRKQYYFPQGNVFILASEDPIQDRIIIELQITTDKEQIYTSSIGLPFSPE